MEIEERGSLADPLEGWFREDQFWPTSVGRCVHSDPLFSQGICPAPTQVTRSDSDVATCALTLAGAERVPREEFWALSEFGDTAAVLEGRDSAVWLLQQRPVCARRREYRMGVRLGEKASGKLAPNPLMTLADTPPGIRLSSPRETLPLLASYQQVGFPAFASPDAQLGRSVYTYQSGEGASGPRGAGGHVLLRAVGQRSRARSQTGGKTKVARRAKVGSVCAAARSPMSPPRVRITWDSFTRPRTLSCSYGKPLARGGHGGIPPPSTWRRMHTSQKIGTQRRRLLTWDFPPSRTLLPRRWVVFAI